MIVNVSLIDVHRINIYNTSHGGSVIANYFANYSNFVKEPFNFFVCDLKLMEYLEKLFEHSLHFKIIILGFYVWNWYIFVEFLCSNAATPTLYKK